MESPVRIILCSFVLKIMPHVLKPLDYRRRRRVRRAPRNVHNVMLKWRRYRSSVRDMAHPAARSTDQRCLRPRNPPRIGRELRRQLRRLTIPTATRTKCENYASVAVCSCLGCFTSQAKSTTPAHKGAFRSIYENTCYWICVFYSSSIYDS